MDRLAREKTGSETKEIPETSQPAWFIPLLVLLLVFIMAARTPLDSDMWWHLRAGEATLQAGSPVLVDAFSTTRAGATWINHSWLAQAGMSLTHRLGGTIGLAALVASLAALSLGLVYLQMEGPPILRAFILVMAAAVAAPVWSPRPQLASLVLFGAVGYLLYLYKYRRKDRLWLLAPLFVLWSNLHGGYVLGLLLVGAMAAGETLNHLLGFGGQEVLSWKRILRLVAWGVAGALLVLINPNGLGMWAIPFQTLNVGALQSSIPEWASPDFHQISQQPFLWLLMAILGTAGASKRRMDGSDLVGVALFARLSFMARRNFGPFAMLAAPVLARQLAPLLHERWYEFALSIRRIFGNGLDHSVLSRPIPLKTARVINLTILSLLAIAAVGKLSLVARPEFVEQASRDLYPVGAIGWLGENHPSGPIFNAYDWGGYLLWMLDEYPVFVDGRTDLFGGELLHSYMRAAAGQAGWEAVLSRYTINLVLMQASSGLVKKLEREPDWVKAYSDSMAVVFVRRQSMHSRETFDALSGFDLSQERARTGRWVSQGSRPDEGIGLYEVRGIDNISRREVIDLIGDTTDPVGRPGGRWMAN